MKLYNLDRPPSKRMVELLKECHKRELLNLDPSDAGMVPFVGGLIHRGMLTAHPYMTKTGKTIMGLFVTNKGRAYLSQL